MFQTEYATAVDSLSAQNDNNYVLQKKDFLTIRVYTNKGELIIDPNFQLRKELGGQGGMRQGQQEARYLIEESGIVTLPMVGAVTLVGMTLNEANTHLQTKYNKFYEETFVYLQVANRRVIVLGGSKGGTVIPLENEKTTLLEVLAIYGGVDNNSRAHNIRLIRGDLKDPEVQIIDLTTIEGMKKANLEVQPNDVVYIEPIRKPVVESLRDAGPILSFVTSMISLGVLIYSLNN
ncbi:MAG: polysaccharide export protein EpsE [Cytophagales bacterium]|nr:polysaccharide export protein EpsE [Cytophagales bacterium]